jgi:ribonuclease HI
MRGGAGSASAHTISMSKSPSSLSAELVAHIDGAARGNPGPAAYGVVVESADGAPRAAFSRCLGRATNNVAEYEALLAALEYALNQPARRLVVLSDSELLVRQLEGRYKVKSPGLKPRFERAREMIARLQSFRIRHVPRSQNAPADRLANQALDAAARAEGGHKDRL